jgi:peptidyl-prolyl cis-trans isomerase D
MLIAMKSKVAKWVLTALMLLVGGGLIISLGFGDLYRSVSRQAPAISVGDTDIYRYQVDEEFGKLVDQMSQAFGANIDPDQARAMGLMDSAVRNIVTKTLFEKYAADLGLTASEEMVLARLASQPGLLDAEGRLDPLRLAEAMRSMGITQEGLIAMISQDIVRDQLYAPVAMGSIAPVPVVDLIFGYRNERRTADTVLIAASTFPEPAEPDEGTLAAYHEANGDRFMAPEYRSIDFVWFTPETFTDTILVDDAQLREEYEARKAEFDQPERRKVEQILFTDQATAAAAVDRIEDGEEFAAVAQDMTGAPPIDMGEMEATGIVSDLSILVDTAFATAIGEIGGPLETALGWHVIRVNEVLPAHTPTFEEVRDLLTDEMKQSVAVDRMIETANLIDDQLAAGAGLKDAAAAAGIDAITVDAIDANGLGPDSTPVVTDDPANFVGGLAFQTEPGDTSLLTEDPDGNGYAVVQVNGATPSAIRPLDQVRADVLESWRADERLRLAKEKAEAMAAAVNAGGSLADLAAADGFTVVTSKPVTRSEGDSVANLTAALTGELFGLQSGAAVSGPVGSGYVVAVLKSIEPADPVAEPDRIEGLRARTETDVATDLLNSMATALHEEYPVEIDQAVIDQEF